MPRVERDAEVTLVVLVYRSLRWLEWCQRGVDESRQDVRYRWLVVANDATEEVRGDPRVHVDWQNADPAEHYISRVYRAWNEGVLNSPTQWCVLLNTDMFATNHALDTLWMAKGPRVLPCGLLVEQGRIPSGMPEYVKDFGTNPDNFKRAEFVEHAARVRQAKREPGRLFMPVLFNRQQFLDRGGYPEGNVGGVSGDRVLFDKFVADGWKWETCLGSVWYHCQEGEQRWPTKI
jgi:hypothetical protein